MNARSLKLLSTSILITLVLQSLSWKIEAADDCKDKNIDLTCAADLCVVPKKDGAITDCNPFKFRMGDRLQVRVTGEPANKIKEEIRSRPAKDVLSLYFDGTKIPNTPSGIVSSTGSEVLIYFDLVRDSFEDGNKKAWDMLFKQRHDYDMSLIPGLGIGMAPPQTISSGGNFIFYVATKQLVWLMLAVCLLIFFAGFYLLVKTRALRDGSGTSFYSLGKSQMAFWGLLVVLAFVGVWVVNGTMEQIPDQILMLLGISGGTGLSAVIISESKNATKLQQISALQTEQKEITNKQAGGTATPKELARLGLIPDEIKTLNDSPTESTGSYWKDICNDGNGLSFHRLQVVIWTLVLGTIFVVSVVQLMSMPEFAGSLLILMGVSNVTYLGFKIPEK